MTRRINTGAQAGNASFVAAAAIKQAATWGTAVVVGAANGISLTGEGISGGPEALDRQDLGFPFGQGVDVGAEMHSGPLNFDVFHGGGFGALLSFFFGTSGAPTQTPPSTGTTYLHKLTLAQSLDVFATIALAKRQGVQWWELASAMATKFELSGSGNERVKGSVEFIANALSRSSALNTISATNAVTVPTRRTLAYAKQGTFRMAAQAGGALGSPVGTITATDVVPIQSFKITGDRGLSKDMMVDGTNTVSEPAEESEIAIGLEIGFRSYDAETWKDAFRNQTLYKADLTLLSGFTPSGGSAMSILANFANIYVSEDPQAPVSGRGRIAHTVKFKCISPPSAPTGMSGLTTPMEMQILDEVSTAYLS